VNGNHRRVRDRVAPIDEVEAIFETLGAKHISRVSVRGDHFHLYCGCLKCFMQRLEHSRARQIDNGRRGQVKIRSLTGSAVERIFSQTISRTCLAGEIDQ
jgi:hypothetical protein